MRKWKIVFLVFAVLVMGAGLFLYNIFYGANNFADVEKKIVYVGKGETWEQIVDSLEIDGIIRSRQWFDLVVNVLKKGTQTHVGKYEFTSGISNIELYNILRLGTGIVPISVILKEGRRAVSFSRAFHRMLDADTARFMSLVNDESFAHSLGIKAKTLEGYLSPNTYSFNWQTAEEEIIERLVRHTEKIFNDTLRERARELKMNTHEILTLASIIEGEAILHDERAIISGVYHNRLRKGMRLQADPTIQFILPNGPRRVVFSDLRINNPYNTYRHDGLPPGPISNPGVASILAALYPAQHDYLFFVANGRGGHWFSSNHAGHMNNVRKYRKARAERNQGLG